MRLGTLFLCCLLAGGCVPARHSVAKPTVLSERPPHAPVSLAASAASLEKPSPSAVPKPSPTEPVLALTTPSTAETAAEPASIAPLWEVGKGRMLREQMTDWAARANHTLIWNAQNDYELRGSATFQGEFIDAVKTFFAALQANGLALRVTIYQGNKVMEVSEH